MSALGLWGKLDDGIEYHVFALDDGAVVSARVPALDGSLEATVEARCVDSRIEVSAQGATRPWPVLLRAIENVASVGSGTAQADELGVRVMPKAGVQTVTVRLEETP